MRMKYSRFLEIFDHYLFLTLVFTKNYKVLFNVINLE